jgi:hypothetical protein
VRANGRAVVLRAGLIAREMFGVGVILLLGAGITTKEHFGEGAEAFAIESFVTNKGRLDILCSDGHMVER